MDLFAVTAALGGCMVLAACTPPSGGGSDLGAADAAKPFAPVTLRSFESAAEGISDAAKAPDFAKAQAILGEAQTTWNALVPQLRAAGAPAAQLNAVDGLLQRTGADIGARTQRAVETDGNTVSLAVPDFFDLYSYPVPTDVLRGDGVFRQLQIEAEYSDWAMAATDLQAVLDVWARLRPMVASQAPRRPDIMGAATVTTDLDGVVTHCQAALGAKDPVALQTAAQDGLDLIDIAEQIFK